MLRTPLRMVLYNANLTSPTEITDLTEFVEGVRWSTARHGGFKTLTFRIGLTLPEAWQWMGAPGYLAGYHFYRVAIYYEQTVIWEGRIMDFELESSEADFSLTVTAYGYWSACRDQYYSDDDGGGRTNWAAGGPYLVSNMIKEILTFECPDINSDQANIDANTRTLNLDLSARSYPQDIIVDKLAPLADSDNSIWGFFIWGDRKPYWEKRVATAVSWEVYLGDIDLRHSMTASTLRNAVTPVVSGAEGTVRTNAVSLAMYPRRELLVSLVAGVDVNGQQDAAQAYANQAAFPVQAAAFTVHGKIWDLRGSRFVEGNKWEVRAGDVIRIADLVSDTISQEAFDSLRIFYVTETHYDADTDRLTIQPDIFPRSLSGILPRLGQIERGGV